MGALAEGDEEDGSSAGPEPAWDAGLGTTLSKLSPEGDAPESGDSSGDDEGPRRLEAEALPDERLTPNQRDNEVVTSDHPPAV